MVLWGNDGSGANLFALSAIRAKPGSRVHKPQFEAARIPAAGRLRPRAGVARCFCCPRRA